MFWDKLDWFVILLDHVQRCLPKPVVWVLDSKSCPNACIETVQNSGLWIELGDSIRVGLKTWLDLPRQPTCRCSCKHLEPHFESWVLCVRNPKLFLKKNYKKRYGGGQFSHTHYQGFMVSWGSNMRPLICKSRVFFHWPKLHWQTQIFKTQLIDLK